MGTKLLLAMTLLLFSFFAGAYKFGDMPNHDIVGTQCSSTHTFVDINFWREWHLQFFTPRERMGRTTILSVYDPATFPPGSGLLAQLAQEATNDPAEYLRGGPKFDHDVVVFMKVIPPRQEAVETFYCVIDPRSMPAAGFEKLLVGVYSTNPFRFEYSNVKPIMSVMEQEE